MREHSPQSGSVLSRAPGVSPTTNIDALIKIIIIIIISISILITNELLLYFGFDIFFTSFVQIFTN